MFDINEINTANGEFVQDSSSMKYPEGDNEMTITSIEPWKNGGGFGFRFKGNLDKTLYLGMSTGKTFKTANGQSKDNGNYARDLNRFKAVLNATEVTYNAQSWKNDLINKNLVIEIRYVDKKAYKFGDEMAFNYGDYNVKAGTTFTSTAELEASGVETVTFKQEQIIGIKKSELDLTSNISADEFNLSDNVPF